MNEPEFKTTDIYQAAALKCAGFELLRLEKTHRNERQRAFIFNGKNKTQKIREAVTKYNSYDLQIDAATLFEKYTEMQDELHKNINEDWQN
jgi:hypothetical protein